MMKKGDVIDNRYAIIEHIAEGGMSHVYKAVDKKAKKAVAVKILKAEYAAKEKFRQAFEKEARTTMRLKHRHIIHTMAMGQQAGLPFMVMEYVEGESLKEYLAKKGWLTDQECIAFGRKICGALTYAHHKGVIHKDLKPSNILLDKNGEPILSDFGIAEEETEESEQTQEVLGSAAYFSPEQARGETVDQRTDIYSLGVVLYELATGRLPFTAEDSLSMALKHLHLIPDLPITLRPDMLNSLSKVIMRSMEKDREARYPSAAMLERDLSKCTQEPEGEYVRMSDALVSEEEAARRRSAHRHRVMVLSILFTAMIAALFLLIFGLASNFKMEAEPKTYMPNLVNKTEAEAVQTVRAMNLTVKIVYEPTVQEGNFVIRQTPESGVEISEGETIEIVVSQESELQSMPEVVGKTREEALKILSEAGLNASEIIADKSANMESEEIVRQSPEAGQPVGPEERIVLYESLAALREDIETVPNLVGKYVSDAVKEAKEAGFAKVFVYRSTMGEKKGYILSQQPEATDSGKLSPGSIRLTMEYLGTPNYVGTFHVDQALFDQGATIQLTIQQAIDGQECEFVVFESVVENVSDFVERYGTSVDFSVYVPANTDTVKRNLLVYHDGQMVAASEIHLTKKES